ncbi:MAG: CPBP family intramembrane metalloprotease, partial [Nitrospirota bacterium]|nr:CPBP family intramembrane metalloprotease [Nitrospirota bacterium]
MIEPSQSSSLLPDSEGHVQGERPFSSVLTALCLLVCLGGFGLLLWTVAFSDGVRESSMTASRDLERIASRLLGVESRLSDLSAFEQAMFHLWGEDGDTQGQLRLWYAELPEERRHPLDELYSGILDGEAGLRANLLALMEKWPSAISPFPTFRRLLDVGYLENDQVETDYDWLQAKLAEEVPANWFYFQLAGRLASQSGNEALRDNLQQQFKQLTNPQLWAWRALTIFELSLGGIGLIGIVSVVGMWFKNKMLWRVECFSQKPSLWSFNEGLAVLARGGACSIFLIALLAVVPYGITILEDYGSLLLYLPTVALAAVWLGRSTNRSFFEVLGCKNVFQRFKTSVLFLISVIALGLLGDWLIMLGGDVFQISTHWTEWFMPQLVWGSQSELWKTSIEVVVVAPIFEELIFRGILYSTLRAKFGVPASLIGSALIFALAHGYGPTAFLTVFWSGMLWAWVYERTGSLIPGMCAHAIN